MITALLTLGPTYQPNGTLRVIIITRLPEPPLDFYFVRDLNSDTFYRVHKSQLSDYQKIES